MRHYRMEDMWNGWFAGQFNPSVYTWSGGEIALKRSPAGVVQTSYCHPKADKLYIILKGYVQIGAEELGPSHVIHIAPGENISFSILEDATVLLIVLGDKEHEYKIKNITQLLNAYHFYHQESIDKDLYVLNQDISVVIQGPIYSSLTHLCVESIRKFLPGSRIILSTWMGSQVAGLDFDEVIYNSVPEGYAYFINNEKLVNNVNLQLKSTQEGLRRVKSKYVLKIRTDAILTDNCFLKWFTSFQKRKKNYKLFQHKVIISDFYTRHEYCVSKGFFPMPFHVSDFFFFGLTKDIKTYFEGTRQMTKEEQIDYRNIQYPDRRYMVDYVWPWRMAPEQFFALEAIRRKYPEVKMEDWSDWNEENIKQSEQFIMNNFIVLDFAHHGILIPKFEKLMTENQGRNYREKGLYSFSIYCDFYDAMFQKKTEFHGWDT